VQGPHAPGPGLEPAVAKTKGVAAKEPEALPSPALKQRGYQGGLK